MPDKDRFRECDVLIVGAGVTGLSIARELARYRVRVAVIEKEADVCLGVSKTAGSLIYMGLFQAASLAIKNLHHLPDLEAETRTERMRLLWEGFQAFDHLAHNLDVAHKHVGVLFIARDEIEIGRLRAFERLCRFVPGGTVRWLNREEVFRLEPNLTPAALAGLHDTTGTISIFAPEYVIALAENARANGVGILVEAECRGIESGDDGFLIRTAQGPIRARFVLNCGGKYADAVADLAGPERDWNLQFFRSQALVLDRRLDGFISNIVGLPPEAGKIDLLYPLQEGNIHVYGAHYDPIADRDFTATTGPHFDDAIERMKVLAPGLSERDIITSYVGVRVFNDKSGEEHLIESPPGQPGFLNVLVRMPGLTPAPALARKVVNMLAERGLRLESRDGFVETRSAIPRFRRLPAPERGRLIERDPAFGRVVCRCEMVTEGEIVEAIRRGARTVQGVMFRTRAGMGRCQRNLCGPKIMAILARELGTGMNRVTFKGPGHELAV